IWCFPPEKGVYKDRIAGRPSAGLEVLGIARVAQIEHNPDPARAARRCSGAR
ncbi:unnamed protein product, partial [Durusdinium trenchii]